MNKPTPIMTLMQLSDARRQLKSSHINGNWLKGDCTPKIQRKADHPWKKRVYPQRSHEI